MKLTAVDTDEAAAEPGTFRIVSDQATPADNAAATAANLKAALGTQLGFSAKTELKAASAFAAANDFFDNNPPLRVAASPTNADGYPTSTAADATGTVRWYVGADYPDDAARAANVRGSARAEVAEGLDVNYGAQANETGLRQTIKNLAVMSISDYELPGDEGEALYTSKSSRLMENLQDSSGSVGEVRADIASQRVIVDKASKRNDLQKATAQDFLGEVENADTNEVAVMLLQLQTQLQASYQVTAMLSQLSLAKML